MTGSELHAAMTVIGWSRSQLARRLQCDEGTVRAMETGRRPIPLVIEAYIRPIAAVINALPPPDPADWLGRTPGRE